MKTEAAAVRSGAKTTSLCGNAHRFDACEAACLSSEDCGCLWHGGGGLDREGGLGYCHLYSSCARHERVAALSELATTWDEAEFACGTGRFIADPASLEIRSTVVLFGVEALNASGQAIVSAALQPHPCSPLLCSVTLLRAKRQLFSHPGRRLRREHDRPVDRMKQEDAPDEARTNDVRGPTVAAPALGSNVRYNRHKSGLDRRRALADAAVFVEFKLTTSNTSAAVTSEALARFVNAGYNGFWGQLERLGLANIDGVMFAPGGMPVLAPKPAPPMEGGKLFRKVKYQCSEGNVYYSTAAQALRVDNRSLCCGNRSQTCYPGEQAEQPKCYVSSARQYQCLPARVPFAPGPISGVPYDSRVHLYWKAPVDDGGYNISDFIVERVPFVRGQSLEFTQPESANNQRKFCATGLTNFVPWYFRVTASSILGLGPPSTHSSAYTPWVLPPEPPTNVRAASGNRRIYLSWDPPAYDGGRSVERYLVEIRHDRYSRTHCSDPHGCVDDVEAHQALIGHRGHHGDWAREQDAEPTASALEWALVNSEPLTPDCLRAPVVPENCPSLLTTTAAGGTAGSLRLNMSVSAPGAAYPIHARAPQVEALRDAVFEAESPEGTWQAGMCVSTTGERVHGAILLRWTSAQSDDDGEQKAACHALCLAHVMPPEWRDLAQYASGRKTGCELIVGKGWPSRGCYLHTSPAVDLANAAPLRFCMLLAHLPLSFATRRRASQEILAVQEETAGYWQHGQRPHTLQNNAGAIGGGGLAPPVCQLPPPTRASSVVVVLRDGQGNPLMNNYRYHLRIRAYNGFQPSHPSTNITVHPIGRVSKAVSLLAASCYNTSSKPHRCTAGFVADTRARVSWQPPPLDDGVTDVLGFRIEVSSDHGASWSQHTPASERAPKIMEYALTCLLNDQPYLVRVAALNMYGLGAWTTIGPLIPRWCPHLQRCNKCFEPWYHVWGGCSPPSCISLPQPPPPLGTGVPVLPSTSVPGHRTRLINCTAAAGCRVEVFHQQVSQMFDCARFCARIFMLIAGMWSRYGAESLEGGTTRAQPSCASRLECVHAHKSVVRVRAPAVLPLALPTRWDQCG